MNRYTEDKESYKKLLKAPYQLIVLMAVIIVIVISLSQYRLYRVGLEQQKNRLTEMAQNRAVMIRILAETYHGDTGDKREKQILKHLMTLHQEYPGFGYSGEFILVKLEAGRTRFLLQQRHRQMKRLDAFLSESGTSEPMQRALKGESGSGIGEDYRGIAVLAAYESLEALGWGIIAKIDMDEIRGPYLQEGVYSIFWALSLIGIAGILVVRLTQPLAREIESGRQYNRMLFNEIPIGLALTDIDGKIIDVNTAYLNIVGYTTEEIYRLSYWDITPKSYMKQEEEQLKKLFSKGAYGPYEKEYVHKDGHRVRVRLSGRLIENGGVRYIWSHVEDISAYKRTEQALREAALVFEHTHEGIMITDADTRIVRINRTFTDITGYSFEEVEGKNPNFLQSGSHDDDFYGMMWKTIRQEGMWYGEIHNRRKNGEYFTALQSISAVKNSSGIIRGYVSVFSDISERKHHEMQLVHLATHDTLTSLPNRMHFRGNLEQALSVARRNRQKLVVCFLDLNRFKEVNDTLGHHAGDELLKIVAERLKSAVREEDTVARLAGDEFAIILPELQHADDALKIAAKLTQAVSAPFTTAGTTIEPSISIGISIYPDHGDTGDVLLSLADTAMYAAKRKSAEHYVLYQDGMQA